MSTFRIHKVVAALPSPLEANAVYAVRVGDGFDLYVSDSTGSMAFKVNSEGGGGGGGAPAPLVAVKTADTTRINTNVIEPDPDLWISDVPANSLFEYRIMTLNRAAPARDFLYRIDRSGLADASLQYTHFNFSGGMPIAYSFGSTLIIQGASATGSTRLHWWFGTLRTGAESGSFGLSWAQYSAGPENSTILADSYIALRQIA